MQEKSRQDKEKMNSEIKEMLFLYDYPKKVNSKCPIKIDSFTRLDSVSYNQLYKDFNLYYTYIGFVEKGANIDSIQSATIIEGLKKDTILTPFKNIGVDFTYTYRDNNGKRISYLRITPEQYQTPIRPLF